MDTNNNKTLKELIESYCYNGDGDLILPEEDLPDLITDIKILILQTIDELD